MKKTREKIKDIEETLLVAIAEATLKRDLNKIVATLTESVKSLVGISKEMVDALDPEIVKAPVKKAPVKKAVKPAAKVEEKPSEDNV